MKIEWELPDKCNRCSNIEPKCNVAILYANDGVGEVVLDFACANKTLCDKLEAHLRESNALEVASEKDKD